MPRFELTDLGQLAIEPLLPTKLKGLARVDDQRELKDPCWRLQTDTLKVNIPEQYVPNTIL